MQRFGTSSIPTHSIGLAFLKCEWEKAVSLIMQHRPGEDPSVVAARDAFLIEKNIDKALELIPRRVVAERCILESFKKMKGDTRNAFGALSTVCVIVTPSETDLRRGKIADTSQLEAHVRPRIPIVCVECHRFGAYSDARAS